MPLTRVVLAALVALGAALSTHAKERPHPIFGVPLLEITGLEEPSGACFDESGVLHVAEARAHRVSRFGPDGRRLGSWGDDGELSWPRDLSCTTDGLLVLDSGHGRIVASDTEGRELSSIGSPGNGPGELHDPRAIAVRGDEVVVADTGNDRVLLLRRTPDCAEPPCLEFELRLGPFAQPRGAAFLGDGSLLVANTQDDQLVRLEADGFTPSDWGARGEAPGLFSRPTGLATSGGLVYSVDTENHRVQVFDGDGERIGGWGRHAWLPHEGEGKLHYPEVVAIDDRRGVATICEPFEGRCQLFTRGDQPPDPARDRLTRRVDRSSHYGKRISAGGRMVAMTEMDGTSVSLMDLPREIPILVHRLGRPGRGHGLFRDVVAAIIDGPRRVIVADSGSRRIATFAHDHDLEAETRFDPRLSRLVREIDLERIRTEPRIRPVALARGGGDELFVLDAAGSRIVVLDRDGLPLRAFGGFGEEPGRLRFPSGIAYHAESKRLLVVDSGNARVQLFSESGELLQHWGGHGRGDGEFIEPFGACFGRDGRIFVVDRGSHRVQRFSADGRFELSWGDVEPGAPAAERLGAGQLHRPTGIAQVGDGRLLVVDHGNHRGQIFTPAGEWVTAFGARLYTRPTRGAKKETSDGP
jgi:sugar lactone lactonase YvrE